MPIHAGRLHWTDRWSPALKQRVLSCVLFGLAAAPFLSPAMQVFQQGVPDYLFAGDAATLELRVLEASRGWQLLGPYSRFEWHHPGPAYFYMALPIYELFGHRGPSLNVFALIMNFIAAMAISVTVQRLFGTIVALLSVALLTMYTLIGVPFLLANEWNPILPILPFVLASLLAMRLALGGSHELPCFAFVSSAIVQTHVAYAPEIIGLSALVVLSRRAMRRGVTGGQIATAPSEPISAGIRLATVGVLLACWVLPVYEAVTNPPGNLVRVATFFLPRRLSEHSLRTSIATVLDQLSVMPGAVLRALRFTPGVLHPRAAMALGMVAVAAAVAMYFRSGGGRDATTRVGTTIVLSEFAIAVLSVSSIRGPIEFYLVAWISALGFVASVLVLGWVWSSLRYSETTSLAGVVSAIALTCLGLSAPVTRAPVFNPPDLGAARLAQTVESHLLASNVDRTLVELKTRATWPFAAAVVLRLSKDKIPVSVTDDWLFMVGKQFALPAGSRHATILVGDRTFSEDAVTHADLTLIASSNNVYVYLKKAA